MVGKLKWGPSPLNMTGRHDLFLKSTCDEDYRHRKNVSDMTCAILKFDM